MRIKMRVEGYTKQTKQSQHNGWGHPEVQVNKTVYLIKYVGYDGYFTYGYLSHDQAQNVINTMIEQHTDTLQFYPFNRVLDPEAVIIK